MFCCNVIENKCRMVDMPVFYLHYPNTIPTRDGKNAHFSLSLVIVILIFKNRYLSLFTFKTSLVIVSYFIIIVISIVMSNQ